MFRDNFNNILLFFSSYIWEESPVDDETNDNDTNGIPHFTELPPKDSVALEEMYQLYRVNAHDVLTRNAPSSVFIHKRNFFFKNFEASFGEEMCLVQPRQARLRRTSRRGLWFLYSASAHITQFHLKVSSLQVDNQLLEHTFPVAFSPVYQHIPHAQDKKAKKKIKHQNHQKRMTKNHSFIQVIAIVQTMTSVTRYKNVQVFVQEFSLRVDWGWISEILALFNIVDVGVGGDGVVGIGNGTVGQDFSTRMLIYQDLEAIVKVSLMNKNYFFTCFIL